MAMFMTSFVILVSFSMLMSSFIIIPFPVSMSMFPSLSLVGSVLIFHMLLPLQLNSNINVDRDAVCTSFWRRMILNDGPIRHRRPNRWSHTVINTTLFRGIPPISQPLDILHFATGTSILLTLQHSSQLLLANLLTLLPLNFKPKSLSQGILLSLLNPAYLRRSLLAKPFLFILSVGRRCLGIPC